VGIADLQRVPFQSLTFPRPGSRKNRHLCDYACSSPQHVMARRSFLGGLAAGMGGAADSVFDPPLGGRRIDPAAEACHLHLSERRLSQLESWDPKPKTDTGGPFRAIPTSVPGLHISELLPATAQ